LIGTICVGLNKVVKVLMDQPLGNTNLSTYFSETFHNCSFLYIKSKPAAFEYKEKIIILVKLTKYYKLALNC